MKKLRGPYRKLTLVRQLDEDGCGIACVAMIAGKKYMEVLHLAKQHLPKFKLEEDYRTHAKDIATLLERLGVGAGKKRIPFKNFEQLPPLAVLAINYKKNLNEWHWVVYQRIGDKASVLDPNPKLKNPHRTDFLRLGKNCKWYVPVTSSVLTTFA